ncbi:MAG: oligosaccharide flippase family protein [Burkholderiaceae bacterium]
MSELARKTSRGAIWRAIETAGSEGMSFLMFVMLARLLVPEDFGLVALASSIVLTLQCLLQFGLPEALIQRDRVDESMIRAAMAASAALAVALVGFSWLIAWPLAWLLERPEFPRVFLSLVNVLLLQGLSFPLHALLRRELELRAIAIRTLTATSVGGMVALGMAWSGMGFWALVTQQLTVAAVGLVMLVRACPFKPWRMRMDRLALRPLWAVARPVMAGQFATQAARRLDAVVLGLFLGNHDIGIYFLITRVIQAGQMVTQFSIGEIAMAVLSRLQHDRARLLDGVRRAMRLTGFVCLLAFGALALLAPWLVPLVFGQTMAAAAEPLRTLALFASAGALISTAVHALVSVGAATRASWLAVGASLFQLAAIGLFAGDGIASLVVAIGVAQLLLLPVAVELLARTLQMSRIGLLADLAAVLGVFAIAWWLTRLGGLDATGIALVLWSTGLFSIVMLLGGAWLFRRELAWRTSIHA